MSVATVGRLKFIRRSLTLDESGFQHAVKLDTGLPLPAQNDASLGCDSNPSNDTNVLSPSSAFCSNTVETVVCKEAVSVTSEASCTTSLPQQLTVETSCFIAQCDGNSADAAGFRSAPCAVVSEVCPQQAKLHGLPLGGLGRAASEPVACRSLLSGNPFVGPSNCPPHGAKAVVGKRSTMEDAFAVLPNFCELPVSPNGDEVQDKFPSRIASQFSASDLSSEQSCRDQLSQMSEQDSGLASSCNSDTSSVDKLHFFAVYDGHGGVEAAQHCAKRLHCNLLDHISNLTSSPNDPAFGSYDSDANMATDSWNAEPEGPTCIGADLDNVPSAACTSCSEMKYIPQPDFAAEVDGQFESGSDASSSSNVAHLLEDALKEAFLKTDEQFSSESGSALVGSTAVVALVGSRKIWVANCGDSRAVLCRRGKALQVTDDHKPEREDEAERVEKAGGQVLYWNGHRVMGVLAMSRAIGDHCLRPYVIPDPEITVFSRTEDDELLLLASDGLWDVMNNQEASDLANRCLQRARERGASGKAAARIAAAVLTRAAVDRGSRDNVTVVIVDLRNPANSDSMAVDGAVADLADK